MTSQPYENTGSSNRPFWLRAEILVLFMPAAAKLILHILTHRGYGIFGDELYYLACSDHLDWGYVDHPPLSILLLHMTRALFGDSVLSIRWLPGLAGAATVLLTGLIARRMGAGLFAQLLAEVCVLVAPVYLAINHYFSMNAFDILAWAAASYILILIIEGGKPTLWLWMGLVVGIGFENKISILFLCFGVAVGLLLTKERRLLPNLWLLFGALIAVLLILPNILWQISHGWPTLEWMANARSKKMVSMSPAAYLTEQIVLLGPLSVLVWGTGLVCLFFHPVLKKYRLFGWCYLALFALFILEAGKPYYLAPIYPVLYAGGAIVIERLLRPNGARVVAVTLLLAFGALAAPLGLPVLPVETYISYSSALGIHPASGERAAEGKVPSFFANMFGWDKLEAVVDSVYHSLPKDEQSKCGIFCQNYMQAGAIDFYGRRDHLPRAMCGHNSYWTWGMGGCSGEIVIVLGSKAEDLKKYYKDVTQCAVFHDEYIQPMHNNVPIFVVRKPKQPLGSLWPGVRFYI